MTAAELAIAGDLRDDQVRESRERLLGLAGNAHRAQCDLYRALDEGDHLRAERALQSLVSLGRAAEGWLT